MSINKKRYQGTRHIFQDAQQKHFQYICYRLLLSSIQYGCSLPSSHQDLPVWFQMVFIVMDIPAWVGTTFQKQKRQTQLLWMVLWGSYQLHIYFCPPCLFHSLGKTGNLIYHQWKFLWGLEECPMIFHLLQHLQSAAAYNWKRKIYYVGKHRLPKKYTIINSLFIIVWYLHNPVWQLMVRLYCQ